MGKEKYDSAPCDFYGYFDRVGKDQQVDFSEPTDAQVVAACKLYREDFQLLEESKQKALRGEAIKWLTVWRQLFSL